MQRLLEFIARIKRATQERGADEQSSQLITQELKQLGGLKEEDLARGPTRRQVKQRAAQILREQPDIQFEEAKQMAARQLIPVVIQVLLQGLPENIEHEPGDSFYPDMFYRDGKVFARGNLDEDLIYHLWHPELKARYDLFQKEDLDKLILDIVTLSNLAANEEVPSPAVD